MVYFTIHTKDGKTVKLPFDEAIKLLRKRKEEERRRKEEEKRRREALRPKHYIIRYKHVKKPVIGRRELELAEKIYLENIRKGIYDEKNLRQLRAFGWSEERIRKWQEEELRKAREYVKNKENLRKIAENLARKGKINVKFTDVTEKVIIPVHKKPKPRVRPIRKVVEVRRNIEPPKMTVAKPPAKPKRKFDIKKAVLIGLGALIILKILKR